jgi:hypothetical protein
MTSLRKLDYWFPYGLFHAPVANEQRLSGHHPPVLREVVCFGPYHPHFAALGAAVAVAHLCNSGQVGVVHVGQVQTEYLRIERGSGAVVDLDLGSYRLTRKSFLA